MKQRIRITPHHAGRAALALNLLAALVGSAWAQAGPDEAQTIVVTAQKRKQLAQDVPVSLTAISGRKLEEAGVGGIEGIDQLAAGVTVGASQAGQLNISMRGISNLSGNLLAGPAAGMYQDESPLSAFSQLVPQFAFFDAERVEVLRGPQGTLFGEGSMGGTIRIITNKPDSRTFGGKVQLQAASVAQGESGITARGVLNVPLVTDQLALRVGFSRQDILGWVDIPELQRKDANSGRQQDARVALRWAPSRQLTIDLSHDHQTLDVNNPQASSWGVWKPSDVLPAAQPVGGLSTSRSKYDLTALTLNYDFGPASLVTALSRYEQHRTPEVDFDPIVPLFFGGLAGSGRQIARDLGVEASTVEVRLVSNGDRTVNWTVGAYHKDDKRTQDRSGFVISVPLLGITDDQSFTSARARSKANALFADVEYKFSDTLALQAGVRRYESRDSQVITVDTTSVIFGTVAGDSRPSSGTSAATSPKLGLSWKPSKNLLVFAKVADGFRNGGSNFVVPTEPTIVPSYGPEKVRSYELGLKSQPATDVTVNASVYLNRWTDLQLTFLTPSALYNYIQNAGRAKATGGEVEVNAHPLPGLRVGVALGLVDSTIDEDVFNALGQKAAAKGNRIPYSPRTQAAASVSYDFTAFGGLGGSVSANLSRRSATFSEPDNFEETRNDSATNLYLRLGLSGQAWGAALFVNNATNDKATLSRLRYVGSTQAYGTYVQPRTVGVELNAQF